MKKLKLIMAALFLFSAHTFAIADNAFKPYTLQDQHGNEHRLQGDTRVVIMSFEMSLAKKIHKWLAAKEADYLAKNKAEYVVDISPMPGIITKLFAGPKMKRYKFPIIQATSDDFADGYPHEKRKITVFLLGDSQETATVHFVSTTDELEALFDPALTASDIEAAD